MSRHWGLDKTTKFPGMETDIRNYFLNQIIKLELGADDWMFSIRNRYSALFSNACRRAKQVPGPRRMISVLVQRVSEKCKLTFSALVNLFADLQPNRIHYQSLISPVSASGWSSSASRASWLPTNFQFCLMNWLRLLQGKWASVQPHWCITQFRIRSNQDHLSSTSIHTPTVREYMSCLGPRDQFDRQKRSISVTSFQMHCQEYPSSM